jgi:hypothetical protein
VPAADLPCAIHHPSNICEYSEGHRKLHASCVTTPRTPECGWSFLFADELSDRPACKVIQTLRACLGGRVMERIEGARIPHYSILNSEGL